MTGSARLDPAAPPVPVGASYVELAPQPRLRRAIRTVWVQRTGAAPYVQTHLPTGGTELHLPFGGAPRLVGPLTGPLVEVLPPRSTLVGVRFLPGAAPGLWDSTHELVDQQVELSAVWGDLPIASATSSRPSRIRSSPWTWCSTASSASRPGATTW